MLRTGISFLHHPGLVRISMMQYTDYNMGNMPK
jgi:hypothetical protein